jgi:uncharacterized protein YeaO (DUF488 family)
MGVSIKRAYEPAEPADGARFLVDRLWPRGISKVKLGLAGWLKEVAPSTELRQQYCHDPKLYPEFRRRYRAELEREPAALAPLLRAARAGKVTLVFAARDPPHSNAAVLSEFLEERLGPTRAPSRRPVRSSRPLP